MRKKRIYSAAAFAAAFLLLIPALRTIDVQPIGPQGSEVGLAALNLAVHDFFGLRLLWYDITDYLGLAAIAVALGFAVLGLFQLICRRSFKKVDTELYILGGFYLVVLAIYIFFEICIVNYRPVILGTNPEASFPSSHTSIVICILGTAIAQFRRLIKCTALRQTAVFLCYLIILVTITGRLISGVHWFTDILGGLLLSAALLNACAAAMPNAKERS